MLPAEQQQTGPGSEDLGLAVVVVVVGALTVVGANQTDQLGPILTFAGVVLTVTAAAVAAGRRLTKQLAAERERLAMQLAHDRELADLDALRAVLDDAAATMHEATTLSITATLQVELHGAGVRQAEPELWGRLQAAIEAVETAAARVTIRVGSMHDVARSLNDAHGALIDLFSVVTLIDKPPEQDEEPQDDWPAKARKAREEFASHAATFETEAVALAGVRIRPTGIEQGLPSPADP